MSPSSHTPYHAPRSRSEVLTAVGCVVGILVLTMALLWFLRPNRDDGPSGADLSPIPAQITQPSESTTTTVPTDATTTSTTP